VLDDNRRDRSADDDATFTSGIAQVPYGHRDVQRLTREVQEYYVRIYGGPDTTPVDPSEFAPPRGAFFVGYRDDAPVSMGGWRFYTKPLGLAVGRPAEIKRMYVVESARGLGLAREMLAHLELTARRAGADVLVLETGSEQPAAIELYRSSGYVDVPRFGHYQEFPEAVHLGKLLFDRP
jgi:ribosomal protein S18 acetylase RimI-like enzyme